MTKCFEPDSIDLIKPLAVDERDGDDDDDDDDGDMDIIIFLTIPSQYRHIDLCATNLKAPNNRINRRKLALNVLENFSRHITAGSTIYKNAVDNQTCICR